MLAGGGLAAGASDGSVASGALTGRETLQLRAHPRGILQVVTVPISIGLTVPDLLGTLSLGVLLDARQAERPAQVHPDTSPRPVDDGPTFATLEELVADYGRVEAVYKYVHPDTNRIEPFTRTDHETATAISGRVDLVDSVCQLADELLIVLSPRRFLAVIEPNLAVIP